MLKNVFKIIYISLLIFEVFTTLTWFSPYRSFSPVYHIFFKTKILYTKTCNEIILSNKNLTSNNASLHLTNNFNKLVPFWLGTRWSFYGTTYTHGEGSIACGYFVTTLLQHLGVRLSRNALAQCASEEMIKTLCSKQNIEYANDKTIEYFNNLLLKHGNGLYIIGLDNHTGFILVQNKKAFFIHSSGHFPFGVLKEAVLESTVLMKSHYKVFGKISADKKFMQLYLPLAL